MRAFAHSLCLNRAVADDLVQDALVKAWVNFARYEAGTNLRAWLFTILRNTYYSHLRKARHEAEDIDGVQAASLVTRPDHDGRLAAADVMDAVSRLSDEQQEALFLVGSSGFTYEEAAFLCGVSLGTLKSRISRGRRSLCEIMGIRPEETAGMTDAGARGIDDRQACGCPSRRPESCRDSLCRRDRGHA